MAILLKDQYESGVNHNLNDFKKLLKISDFQEEWLQLNVLSFLGCWQKLLTLFITEVNKPFDIKQIFFNAFAELVSQKKDF